MIRPGFITKSEADRINAALASAEESKQKLERRAGGTVERFPAKLTSYDSGTDSYAWTEQTYDTAGARIDKPDGRAGTATWMPAKAIGGGDEPASYPVEVELRGTIRTGTLGPVYEFDWPLSVDAGGGGFTPTTVYNPSSNYDFITNGQNAWKTLATVSSIAAGTYLIGGWVNGSYVGSISDNTTTTIGVGIIGRFSAGSNVTLYPPSQETHIIVPTSGSPIPTPFVGAGYSGISGEGTSYPSVLVVSTGSGSFTYEAYGSFSATGASYSMSSHIIQSSYSYLWMVQLW